MMRCRLTSSKLGFYVVFHDLKNHDYNFRILIAYYNFSIIFLHLNVY